MNREERIAAHDVAGIWLPRPVEHLYSSRDAKHFRWTLEKLADMPSCSVLDVGAYDSWLNFLLMEKGYACHGVELIPNLCASAREYARIHGLNDYKVYQGFFDEVDITEQYDVVMAYEVLEHVPLDVAYHYVARMEKIAAKRIFISLPDQDMKDNPQHCFTPSKQMIENWFGNRKGFKLEYQTYPGTEIPGNFFISYDAAS
jgi:2-polyprenyl-3-methyl-5-hydroxy-6-metoxy-1,4-benzoquinol methylase